MKKMESDDKLIVSVYDSPCGSLVLGSVGEGLCLCDWRSRRNAGLLIAGLQRFFGAEISEGSSAVIVEASRQLDEYFALERRQFDMSLLFAGTPFQKAVWQALSEIPYGSTDSYAGLARRIGHPKAVRAVANAIGANALSVFIPCHRVVGTDGSLTGYAGGLEAKHYLLKLENAV